MSCVLVYERCKRLTSGDYEGTHTSLSPAPLTYNVAPSSSFHVRASKNVIFCNSSSVVLPVFSVQQELLGYL